MENRNSNITSIIVAIISIGLIIFSVWLLNATFNNRSRETTIATNSNSSSSTSSSTNSSSMTEIISSSRGTVIDPNEINPGISRSSSQSSSGVSSSTNSSQSNSSSSSSRSGSSNSNSSTSTSLKSGEITAVLIEPTARGSNFEVIECNIPSPVFCKAGFRFPYGEFDSNGALTLFNGTVGDKYIFTGGEVTDTADGLSIGGVTPQKIS